MCHHLLMSCGLRRESGAKTAFGYVLLKDLEDKLTISEQEVRQAGKATELQNNI